MTHLTQRGKSEKGACSEVYRDVIESDESFEERIDVARKRNSLQRCKSATKGFWEVDLKPMNINYKLVDLFVSELSL